MLEALVVFVGAYVLVYGTLFYACYKSITCFLQGRKLCASLALAVAISPIVGFCYAYYSAEADFRARKLAIANLPRKPITEKGTSYTLNLGINITRLSDAIPNPKGLSDKLVATGVVAKVLNGHHTVIADWGEHCVSAYTEGKEFGGYERSLFHTALARNAFHSCSKEGGAQVNLPYELETTGYLEIPGVAGSCGRNISGSSFGLRWAQNLGGDLIAYDELPYRMKMTPSLILWPSLSLSGIFGMKCEQDKHELNTNPYQKWEPYRRIDRYNLIASALDYKTVEDFPRKATSRELIAALRILSTTQSGRLKDRSNAILLLLGQWPSSNETDSFFKTTFLSDKVADPDKEKIVKWVLEGMRDYEWREKRDPGLRPHLLSHIRTFLSICRSSGNSDKFCEEQETWASSEYGVTLN